MAQIFSLRRSPELAVDFGTANMRVVRRDGGVLFDEPSLCCFTRGDRSPTLVAAGSEAQAMVDRTPASLEVRRPLSRGVLQDIDAARALLRYAMPRALGRERYGAPRALFGVPADATQAERKALLTAASDAGLGPVRLVPESFAAAIGADLPVYEPTGTMIVECGAGTTEIAVISLGGICLAHSVRTGGAALNQAIADHLHFQHKFLIGDLTAEQIKRDLFTHEADAADQPEDIEVKGRSLASARPMSIRISRSELVAVAEKHVAHIVEAVGETLGKTPPELSRDIHDNGIILAGGAAMPLLRDRIAAATGLPVAIADDPDHCVTRGLQQMLADPDR